MVRVGCKSLAFESIEQAMAEIVAYTKDPIVVGMKYAHINLDTMNEFKQYRRKLIVEFRSFQEGEQLPETVSIWQVDRDNGSPKVGDMIARNPKNHDDQWLVAKQYFEDNFEPCGWCFSFSS
jgi:hypothetical protein